MSKKMTFDYPNPQMGLVLQHFYDLHPEVVDRAGHQFFDNVHAMQERVAKEKIESLFNEWFIYDFHLKTDKTALETYLHRNPDNLDARELDLMKQALDSNFTGYFWIEKVDPESQLLVLRQFDTGKIYEVHDMTASQSVTSNAGIVAIRMIQIDGDWFFASDPIYFMPIPALTESAHSDGSDNNDSRIQADRGQDFLDVVKLHYGFHGTVPPTETNETNPQN